MHPADIKAALYKRGKRQKDIAAALGLTEGSVSHVIRGEAKSQRVARRISDATGIPVSRLWPGRYPSLELAEIRGRKAA